MRLKRASLTELIDFCAKIVHFRRDFFELLLGSWLQLVLIADDLGKAAQHAQGEYDVLRLEKALVI
jgi:hypothetical protein